MTASAGAWYRVGTVNVTNGQQAIVGIGTNWQNDVIAIAIGDIFTVDSKTWYEVTAVNSDTSIMLDRNFEGTTAAATNYAIVRNTSGTILTRIAGQVSVQFNQKQLFLDELRTWLNSDNASEELTDSHGVKQELKTPSQMVRDHDDKLAQLDEVHPFPWAMRKVEFEARRAANNEKYAASGFVHKGNHYTRAGYPYSIVNNGLYCVQSQGYENSVCLGVNNGDYTAGDSKTDHAVINIAGLISKLESISEAGAYRHNVKVKLPPAEDGTRTYDSATGVSVTHATAAIAFASETETNKVVTDRVDMFGFEAFLREINDADPFVYANGLIQSQATSINGVATVSDNVRPASYFAWYEGDTSSRGKGVNWQTASEAQRIAIASDTDNNIYFDDATGKFHQWCVRGRSFAGLGNGDWSLMDPASSITSGASALSFKDASSGTIGCQGINAVAINYDRSIGGRYIPSTQTKYPPYSEGIKSSIGAYTAANGIGNYSQPNTSVAVDGECYFLVCGTVNRLNKGAYHPGINPLGSAACANNNGGAIGGAKWNTTNLKITSLDQCFNFKTYNSTDVGVGAYFGTGSITSTSSLAAVRPDGRFYDAIYASGQGGVCRDMRYSAWGLTQEDFADADLAIKSGEYRGCELLKFTRVFSSVAAIESGYTIVNQDNAAAVVAVKSLTTSVAAEFIYTEVIGEPANILLCDDLKYGWVGSYLPDLPDGTKDEFQLTRPCSGSGNDITRTHTLDNGATWTQAATAIANAAKNTVTVTNMPANQVTIWQYKTKAKMTKNAVNSAVRNINNVLISDSASQARDLCFSLTGNITTSTSNQAVELSLNQIGIDLATGKLSASKETQHVTIPLAAPTNNSPAFKALNYNVVEKQQGFINYAYTELKHNGTDWGDDSKIHIADNQTTMLDENGNTVLVGTARCVEPLGWIKNDK